MRSLRCLMGRHDWRMHRNPEKGGAGAAFEVCARCGKDRVGHEQTDGRWLAGGGMGGMG